MSNDVRYSCTSSDNVLALSNLGLNVCLLGCTSPQLLASLLNAVKVVRLRAERQRRCLGIDSNGVRVHVKAQYALCTILVARSIIPVR